MVTARSCVRVITCRSNISYTLPDPQLLSAMGDKFGLDFKDIETKLGRKIPESLARSITEGRLEDTMDETPVTPSVPFNQDTNASVRLQRKMTFLKQEMACLRAIDVELMQQLLSINEGIESIKWVMEERGGLAGGSRDSSPAGSLYSLSEDQDTSLGGSYDSLRRDSDGLDAVSVGSYLDTLAEDLPPVEPDGGFSDPPAIRVILDKTPLRKDREANSDEYYCFG